MAIENYKKIMLVLTRKCMFACDYCEAEKTGLDMKEDTLLKTLNMFKKKSF